METILDRIVEDPSVIDTFTAVDIAEARTAITDLTEQLEKSDADVPEDLAKDLTVFGETLTARETALAEAAEARKTRLTAVREAVGVKSEEDTEEADGDKEDTDTPEAEGDETPEAEVTEAEKVAEKVAEPVAASAEDRKNRLDAARAGIPTPTFTPDTGATITASTGAKQGQELNLNEFAKLMGDHHRTLGSNTQDARYTLGQLHTDWGRNVTASGEENAPVLKELWDEWYQPDAVVAALCAPGDITYDIVEVGSVNGILQIPTMNAPRGALTFYPTSSPLALGAPSGDGSDGIVYEWCSDEDNPKPVYEHTCPTATECELCAYSVQHQFDNFHGKFHPESVANILRQSAILSERRLNYLRIQAIIAFANTLDVTAHHEGGSGLIETVRVLASNAAAFRQQNALDRRTPVDVALPMWLPDALAVDAIARGSTVDYQSVVSKVEMTLGQFGIRTQWINDLAPITNDVDFPTTTEALMWGPGGPFELDGGDINVGTYRDSTLNAANQYATFFEYTRAWCTGGIPARHITGIFACANGAVGERVDIDCGSSSSEVG